MHLHKKQLILLAVILFSQAIKCPSSSFSYPLYLNAIVGNKDPEYLTQTRVRTGPLRTWKCNGEIIRCTTQVELLINRCEGLANFLSQQAKDEKSWKFGPAIEETIISTCKELAKIKPQFDPAFLSKEGEIDQNIIGLCQITNLPLAMLAALITFLPRLLCEPFQNHELISHPQDKPEAPTSTINLLQFKEFIELALQILPALSDLRPSLNEFENHKDYKVTTQSPILDAGFINEFVYRLILTVYGQKPEAEKTTAPPQ